jgi:CTP synthase
VKFVIVSGGVLSGLGKGITCASIGLLLKSRGIAVTAIKCDMYLNIDAGTMNPIEHGEVFVTHDGVETDQDLGHYERFINISLTRANYLTNGQVYRDVLNKERALEYDGKCVQPYFHIPPEIINRWYEAGRVHNADVVLIELGGTVGEYEGLLFFEAIRRLKLKVPEDVVLVHVGYLPVPPSIGELKSKPLQQSISQLNSLGLQPDFVVARAEKPVDEKRKEKIAFASGLEAENIISNPDLESVYKVPLVLEEQGLTDKILRKLKLRGRRKDLKEWKEMISCIDKEKNPIMIAVVGKYQKTGDYTLSDSYVCVIEALKHAGCFLGTTPKIKWIDSESLETGNKKNLAETLGDVQAILVPQGWGKRGILGKVMAAQYARENKIPYLGLCFGMQMATIEFARNVLKFKNANTAEADPKTPYPVIHIIPNQAEYLAKKQYGGTIRLGAWPCVVRKGTKLEEAYKKYGKVKDAPWFLPNPNFSKQSGANSKLVVYERHRHRYEFNNKYRNRFERHGFVISGTSPDGELVEAIEIANHPFFVATQFHPEYESRPLTPHPIFISFLQAGQQYSKQRLGQSQPLKPNLKRK